jgi:hypothetical protein
LNAGRQGLVSVVSRTDTDHVGAGFYWKKNCLTGLLSALLGFAHIFHFWYFAIREM